MLCLESTELSTDLMVDADEYFFSVESKYEEDAERLYVEEWDEDVWLEFEKFRRRSSDEDDEDLDDSITALGCVEDFWRCLFCLLVLTKIWESFDWNNLFKNVKLNASYRG